MSPPAYPSPQSPFQGPTGYFVHGVFVPHPDVLAAEEGTPSNPPARGDVDDTPEWYGEAASLNHHNPSNARTAASYLASQGLRGQSGSLHDSAAGSSKKSGETPVEGRGNSLAARAKRWVRSGVKYVKTGLRNVRDGSKSSSPETWSLQNLGKGIDSSVSQEIPPSRPHDASTNSRGRKNGEVDRNSTTEPVAQSEPPTPHIANEPPRLTVPHSASLGAEISAMFTRWCEFVDEDGLESSSSRVEGASQATSRPRNEQPLLHSQPKTAPPASPKLQGKGKGRAEDADPYAWLAEPRSPPLKAKGGSRRRAHRHLEYAWYDL